jgi:hypothetical protein
MAHTITGQIDAWITEYSRLTPEGMAKGGDEVVSRLAFSDQDMASASWTRVGRATVTVELMGTSDIVNSAVASLRARQQKIRADAEASAMQIERQIQTMLAISYESGEVA